MEFLSTAHARKTLETPFTMRNRSDHGSEKVRECIRNTRSSSHRRGRSSPETHFVWKNTGFRASASLSKMHFVRDFLAKLNRQLIHQHHLQSHLHCGNDPTVAKQWDSRPHMQRKKTILKHFLNAEPIRPGKSENDPTTHETVSQTSHRRVSMHRRSGTHFVWKNTGFRASAISQKRISCETSFKTPSATHPPAPLAIPFTLRERSYSCKSQWNSVDRTCTKNTWNPTYNAEPIRPWSETDPSMIRPHTRPSRTRRTAEVDHRRSGTHFVRKNIRLSCICYLSKTHFVRDFLQNSIGNSSTSTTCNPIYSEGTILELQITMEFHRQLIHQHHLQSHLHCGNDPTVANHNGILSTANARNTGDTPFTMRKPIRDRSEHDPTTHETVSHPSHRRGRSSRFGDGLCLEKHRLSCICYLSKTHFVRDFLQNSIGNSSTSTTCNPIYSEGTISLLTLSVTNSFPH